MSEDSLFVSLSLSKLCSEALMSSLFVSAVNSTVNRIPSPFCCFYPWSLLIDTLMFKYANSPWSFPLESKPDSHWTSRLWIKGWLAISNVSDEICWPSLAPCDMQNLILNPSFHIWIIMPSYPKHLYSAAQWSTLLSVCWLTQPKNKKVFQDMF